MNIGTTSNVYNTQLNTQKNLSKSNKDDSSTSFKNELNELEQSKEINDKKNDEQETINSNKENQVESESQKDINDSESAQKDDDSMNKVLDGLKNTVEEVNNLINNNDLNVQEKLMQSMEAGMNFNTNGQPFSAFVQQQENNQLSVSEDELAEENSILSTMEENIAMANRANLMKHNAHPLSATVKNDITIDNIVKSNSVIMSRTDVDFFVNLVNKGEVDINSIEGAQKSTQISKTLADLLAKSMNENKPVRIDFDNDISVIIRITREGKISADFLPSSQIAETYLKENLPLLKQKFDENNIDYEELNQRKHQKQDEKDNQKKGRENE